MFGEQHELPMRPGPARVVWGLSLTQTAALFAGALLSWRFAGLVPPLPFKNFLLAHAHHLLPLAAAAVLCFAKEGRTGLNLAVYLFYLAAFRFRRRDYPWRR